MDNALIRKLSLYGALTDEERQAASTLACGNRAMSGPREDLLLEGEHQKWLFLVLAGWACRYKQLHDGRRQVLSVYLPGDMCDHGAHTLDESPHSVCTLTPSIVVQVDPSALEDALARFPGIAKGLVRANLVSASIQREWLVSLGQRNASERIGHFLCEMLVRQRGIGLANDNSCPMPMTQGDMADALGLTSVHVNRTLQSLRQAGLIELRRRRLIVPDLPALMSMSHFTPGYLHIGLATDAGLPLYQARA